LVVDAHEPGQPWWQRGVAATPGLDGGLLIAGDDVVVGAEEFALPRSGVEVQDPPGLDGEVGIPGEDPRPVPPGSDRVAAKPPAHRGRGDVRHDPAVDGL